MMSKKLRFPVLMLLCLCLCVAVTAAAEQLPYDTYNYDYWGNIVHTPAAYVPENTLTAEKLTWQGSPIGVFKNPQDLCVASDGRVYVADTGNNRIVVLNSNMDMVLNVISGFEADGTAQSFKSPNGVALSSDGILYIADSQNHRIVALDDSGTLVKTVKDPRSEVLEDGFVFTPLKVSVDYAGRVYCIAQNMFEGIMVFDTDGQFTGFFGTIDVKISAWEKFWKRLATKEERSKQTLYIPTEFTGIDVDDEGFVYASNVDSDGVQAVRRLNPRGQDVIRMGSNGNLGGDLDINSSSTYGGASKIVDVVYRGRGIYSLLDSKRGRVFTYDHEGNLLYIFGGLGTQAGTFTNPVAIEQNGDRLIVLDGTRGTILTFSVTEYGSLINQAVALRFDGDETQAVPLWQRVLELDENNELANTGIGKAYLSAGENALAMTYLKRGMNRAYYSVAFKRWRNELLKGNLTWILTGVVVLVIGIAVFRKVRGRARARGGKAA